MSPSDVEKAIDSIVEYRNGLIMGTKSSYTPGVFEKIAADLRVLRQVQAATGEEVAMIAAEGNDGIRRFPKWAQEAGN